MTAIPQAVPSPDSLLMSQLHVPMALGTKQHLLFRHGAGFPANHQALGFTPDTHCRGSPVPLNQTVQVMLVLRIILCYLGFGRRKSNAIFSTAVFQPKRKQSRLLKSHELLDKLGQKGSCCLCLWSLFSREQRGPAASDTAPAALGYWGGIWN